jgi:hypothetical protein
MPDLIPVAASPAETAAAGAARVPAVIGVLALVVGELPGLFRRLSGQCVDACAAGQPGRQAAAAGSFWFQMEAAADAAARLGLALDTARAAALQLHGGEDR